MRNNLTSILPGAGLRPRAGFLSGDGLRARALRSSGLTIFAFGGSNLLRLASNLVLTRILFPEAFGLMALMQVFLTGLEMFSDVGLRLSVVQNKRGDEPEFLNTVWTLQIARGVVLWLGACALAWPVSVLYDEPLLLQMLPVLGLTAIIQGLITTNVGSAERHLKLGRQVSLDLISQAITIVLTVIFAWVFQSVWSLVFGALIGLLSRVLLQHRFLPGIRNRLHWDPTAARDLIGFGKYIFIGSIAGFLVNQADKAILGRVVSLTELGVYNIGLLLGGLPLALVQAGIGKVVFPLYRMRPPAESAANRAHINKARRLVIGACFAASVFFAFTGVPIIETLYDPRYHLAGPMMVLISLGMLPRLVLAGYPNALLAAGDSRRFFIYTTTQAVVQTTLLLVLIKFYGIFGAIVAPGISGLLTYPLLVRLIAPYDANDRIADILFTLAGLISGGMACWLYRADIALLIG